MWLVVFRHLKVIAHLLKRMLIFITSLSCGSFYGFVVYRKLILIW